MDLREARKLIRPEHIVEAARLVEIHDGDGFDWLYERTGRRRPESRYIVFDDIRYPTKAFGFLVAQLAGGTESKDNDMTVNEAATPLKKLGGVEVRLGAPDADPRQERVRQTRAVFDQSAS